MSMLLTDSYRSHAAGRTRDEGTERTKASRYREVRLLIEAIKSGRRDTGIHDLPADLARELDRALAWGRDMRAPGRRPC